MLEKQTNGFIDYCKVSGFKDKSAPRFPATQSPGTFELTGFYGAQRSNNPVQRFVMHVF